MAQTTDRQLKKAEKKTPQQKKKETKANTTEDEEGIRADSVQTNTSPGTDSNLLTLDPRFDPVRIRCADSVGSCAREGIRTRFVPESLNQDSVCMGPKFSVKC